MFIAICDDCRADAEKIRFSLMDINDELEMVYFSTGSELIESVRQGCFYSLVFQNINLKNESGLETAQTIRILSPDTQIIFVSTSPDHAVDAFRMQAADYLLKPCSEADIVKAFARVNMKISRQTSFPVMINTGKDIHVFRSESVIKLESDRHYTLISCKNGRAERLHINFSDAAGKFGSKFIELRRGLNVNPEYIERISGAAVTLSDGSTYILPKARKDSFIVRYKEYITRLNRSV